MSNSLNFLIGEHPMLPYKTVILMQTFSNKAYFYVMLLKKRVMTYMHLVWVQEVMWVYIQKNINHLKNFLQMHV
ncbi:Uncharacterised protein [Klebsiella pneumoniae]|nr:Uncharacterised protein [Klebsiella pneumoniae]